MTTRLDNADIMDAGNKVIVRTRLGGTTSSPQPIERSYFCRAGETIEKLHARLVGEFSEICHHCGNDPCEC